MLLVRSSTTNNRLDTNNIFMRVGSHEYYLPAYTRLNFKKITGVDINNQSATISGTLIISIYFGDLPLNQEQFSELDISLNNEQNLKLSSENTKIKFDKDNKEVQYTFRSVFSMELDCDVFLTPFLKLNLQFTISLRTLKIKSDNATYILKFNMMDYYGDNSLKFSIQESGENQTGDYGLIQNSFRAKYTKQVKICKKKKKPAVELQFKDYLRLHTDIEQEIQSQGTLSKIAPSFDVSQQNMLVVEEFQEKANHKQVANYQHAIFSFSIYKFPFLDIFIIFLPLWVLSIINLMIFFQDYGLSSRISSIATLMIAYSTFLPTIRSRIPPTPNFTLMDIVAQLSIFSSLLCLGRAYTVKDLDSSVVYDWTRDVLFIICLIIVMATAVIIIGLAIWHKLIAQKEYTLTFKIKGGKQKIKFDRKEWHNLQCQADFIQHDFFVPYRK